MLLKPTSQGWYQGQHNIQSWLDYFWGALLRTMKSEGLIKSTGKGRGAKWKHITAGISGSTAVLAVDRKMDQ